MQPGSAAPKSSAPLVILLVAEHRLFTASQNRGYHAGAAPSVKHGHDPQWLLFRRVCNHVFPHQLEPQRARSEIWTPIALIGKCHQAANPVEDFRYHPVGSIRVVLCDAFANVVDVGKRLGVERVSTHAGRRRWRWASVFSIKRRYASSPSTGFTLPLSRSSKRRSSISRV